MSFPEELPGRIEGLKRALEKLENRGLQTATGNKETTRESIDLVRQRMADLERILAAYAEQSESKPSQ